MKAPTLEEFAQELRRSGDIRTMDIADDILALLDIEAEVAEPYSDLCGTLGDYAPGHGENYSKALEWLGDRSNLLAEIEEALKNAKFWGDANDLVKGMIATLQETEAILEAAGWPGEGDFLDALQALVDRAQPKEYDL